MTQPNPQMPEVFESAWWRRIGALIADHVEIAELSLREAISGTAIYSSAASRRPGSHPAR